MLTYKVTLLVIYLVEFYKHSIVDLLQSEELKNFTHFRSNLVDTRKKVDMNKNIIVGLDIFTPVVLETQGGFWQPLPQKNYKGILFKTLSEHLHSMIKTDENTDKIN